MNYTNSLVQWNGRMDMLVMLLNDSGAIHKECIHLSGNFYKIEHPEISAEETTKLFHSVRINPMLEQIYVTGSVLVPPISRCSDERSAYENCIKTTVKRLRSQKSMEESMNTTVCPEDRIDVVQSAKYLSIAFEFDHLKCIGDIIEETKEQSIREIM